MLCQTRKYFLYSILSVLRVLSQPLVVQTLSSLRLRVQLRGRSLVQHAQVPMFDPQPYKIEYECSADESACHTGIMCGC